MHLNRRFEKGATFEESLMCGTRTPKDGRATARNGRLTFWVLQGFSCLLMKHFQLKPLVSKDLQSQIAVQRQRETDNTNFLSFAVLDLETIHNTMFFAYRRQKKTPKGWNSTFKNSGWFFFWIPNIFFGSKLATRNGPCWAGSGSNTAPFLCLSYQQKTA